MRRRTWFFVGLALVVLGIVWGLQGVGVLPGSPMTGVTLWAVVGPLVAVLGAVLAYRARPWSRPAR